MYNVETHYMNETKICTICKLELPIRRFFYHKRRKKYTESCIRCNSKNKSSLEYQRKKRAAHDPNYIIRQRAACIKRECKLRKNRRECATDLQDILLEQYEKQNGKCFYTQ